MTAEMVYLFMGIVVMVMLVVVFWMANKLSLQSSTRPDSTLTEPEVEKNEG